ncbi:MAG: hypothetical protein K0R84_2941 [Clostridia bacterium]|nr:hypothetical protein [Clostridia bacterium]
MSHAITKRSVYLAVKYILLALMAAAIVITLSIGNLFVRSIIIAGIICGVYLKVRRRMQSRSNNEVGYWSGLDNFDIGIFECFNDDDYANLFEDSDHETKSAY